MDVILHIFAKTALNEYIPLYQIRAILNFPNCTLKIRKTVKDLMFAHKSKTVMGNSDPFHQKIIFWSFLLSKGFLKNL